MVPKNSTFIAFILHEGHDGVEGGHSGVLKTLKRTQHSFYWEGIIRYVRKYVQECVICQNHKTSTLSQLVFCNHFLCQREFGKMLLSTLLRDCLLHRVSMWCWW